MPDAAPTNRAADAATAVARALGLRVTEAVPLRASSNAMLHLRPHPVVARVMTGTAALHDDPGAWLTREVAVGAHLADRGAPATAPTTLLPPGPHLHDGLWLTFWALVEETPWPRPPAPGAVGRALRRLHDALATYDGPRLPAFSALGDEVAGLVEGLRPNAWFDEGRVAAARRELVRLRPLTAEAPGFRPIHGDASLSNLLNAPGGPLWNDFEDVRTGPVEWDVAGLVLELRQRGADDGAVAALLAAYGAHRAALVGPLTDLHLLLAVAWHATRAPGHPRSRERLAQHLASWRPEG
jgi:hypothetical protein